MRIPPFASVFALLLLAAAPLHAAPVARAIDYEAGGTPMQGMLVYDDATTTPRPGLVMVPDWMGMNDDQVALAKKIAGKDYVILVADVYGSAVRPKSPEEAGAASKAMYARRADLRARVNAALDQLKAQAGKAPLDGVHWGAIGFCFGGAAALDLARSGADIAGVVAFHANLSRDESFADRIKARVLVLHGADDTFESPEQIAAFQQEMRAAKADWEFLSYGGAVHCFAIPTADGKVPGCRYDPVVARRADAQMRRFFDAAFGAGN
jgi:dienelactone hydrolase